MEGNISYIENPESSAIDQQKDASPIENVESSIIEPNNEFAAAESNDFVAAGHSFNGMEG